MSASASSVQDTAWKRQTLRALRQVKSTTIILGGFLRRLGRDIWKSRHLAWETFRRDIAREYRNSIFGVLLAFLPALVIAAWATLIRHAGVISIPDSALPYAPFVLISLMLWTTFVDSITRPIMGLKSELATIARSTCPGEVVLLTAFLEIGFHFLVRLILIVLAMLFWQIPTTWWLLAMPLALVLLILFGMGIGLILAPLNIFYQDVQASLGAITTFWLFLTPVIIPVPKEGWAAVVVQLNPVTPLLETTRELLTYGGISNPIGIAVTAILSLSLFLFGCAFFRSSLPTIVDRANV